MKELVKVLFVAALLIGSTAAAIHSFQDRALFVPPPDAVAEGFFREVVTERFDQASGYLTDKDNDAPRVLQRSIETRLGDVDDIQAETISSTRDAALVDVRLRSARGSETLQVKVVWNGVAWKVVTPR